jgi:4-hydroxy-3-polyprenylbenzoate decarboxylase
MNDLRDFVRLLKSKNELLVIDREVDSFLEITEIADRVSKAGGPALLFARPKGSSIPVLVNQFGSERRTALGLRVDSLDELGAKVKALLDVGLPTGLRDKLAALAKLKTLASLAPKTVREAPCQEVVYKGEQVDLHRIPVLQCWPDDGGRFITLPLVFTRDPLTGRPNTGMYRMQVYDRNTTGMHWHIHKDAADHLRRAGTRLEAAVAIGSDPAVTYAATAPVPKVLDEMMLAGFLRGRPVDMVRCLTVDLAVPAHAEIVLEGYVEVDELRVEGPFGDHTGFYSPADRYPVFHVTALTHRRDPIYAATVVGRPPMEDCYLAKATERLFLPLLQMVVPEVVDMDLPMEGSFHNCVLVSMRKNYPQQARKVMNAVWGIGQLQFTKFVVVFDADVDVHDYAEAAWYAFSNVDPTRDVMLGEGPLDVLDHASPHPNWGGKMGIDATRKRPDEGYEREWPVEIVMSSEVKARVDAYWPELASRLETRRKPRRRGV